jgi:hypothetical protein
MSPPLSEEIRSRGANPWCCIDAGFGEIGRDRAVVVVET